MAMTIHILKRENIADEQGNVTPVMTVQYRNRIETFPGIFETLFSPVQQIDPTNKEVFDGVLGLAIPQLKLDADHARKDADQVLTHLATEKARGDAADKLVADKDAALVEAGAMIQTLQGHQVEQDAAYSNLERERDDLLKQIADLNQAAFSAEEAGQSLASQNQSTIESMQSQINEMQRSTLDANSDAGRTRNENAQLRIKIQTALNALQSYPAAYAALLGELEAIGIASDVTAKREA